tara:strand:+ start:299 stop:616 length:318 start_codon:yes stop_codon:yes gene_type:complete
MQSKAADNQVEGVWWKWQVFLIHLQSMLSIPGILRKVGEHTFSRVTHTHANTHASVCLCLCVSVSLSVCVPVLLFEKGHTSWFSLVFAWVWKNTNLQTTRIAQVC